MFLLSKLKMGKNIDKEFYSISYHDDEQLADRNSGKNRYWNTCFEKTHVKLPDSYINANYVDGYAKSPVGYIATQLPWPNTFGDLWQMVWNENSRVVVMLISHSASYLPAADQTARYDHLELRLVEAHDVQLAKGKYTESKLELKSSKTGESREIVHLHYLSDWPDHEVPTEMDDYLQFLAKFRQLKQSPEYAHGRFVIHCFGGCGRTGTFIASDSLNDQLERESKFDLKQMVTRLRQQRWALVENLDQYRFVFDCLTRLSQNSGKKK